ncbi:hypothetical protein CANCADRAFT_32312 [Tortispora caseinolytica NRRL Y-17796]|uniref:DNA-directed DNA polymerase n=1 Tax=Tortispora caseinolytica NRRL Y-17796 TaxID=767744 RepID=A0A1E4TAT0_9ASCO|nr:hypothetical protein CANCADRAFT_32312 [Tortispora caseinolytica NRRL Y-17796]
MKRIALCSSSALLHLGKCSRCMYSVATAAATATAPANDAVHEPPKLRINSVGIQHISPYMHQQLFPGTPPNIIDPQIEKIADAHLRSHGLLKTLPKPVTPIELDLPKLQGRNIAEHFQNIGKNASEPYRSIASDFARAELPPIPISWLFEPGWHKYTPDGKPEPVPYPDEDAIVFDTEVLYKICPYPVMATAVSKTAWYGWVSPWLVDNRQNYTLMPLGPGAHPQIAIGHNVGFDRSKVLEEYNIHASKRMFLDTMSLHIASSGMCSSQRPKWSGYMKAAAEREQTVTGIKNRNLKSLLLTNDESGDMEQWMTVSSLNSLPDTAKLHCDIDLDKSLRDQFSTTDKEEIVDNFQALMNYCALDVRATHMVFRQVLPKFFETCPHPITFAVQRHLSSQILPVNRSWNNYLEAAENLYQKLSVEIVEQLKVLAEEAVKLRDDPERVKSDVWLSQLDWTTHTRTKIDKEGNEVPVYSRKLPGYPKWYRDLIPRIGAELKITARSRTAIILLRLAWNHYPIFWSNMFGFTFRAPLEDKASLLKRNQVYCAFPSNTVYDDLSPADKRLFDDKEHAYFRIPHSGGPTARCTNPLAKGYISAFENGILSSEFPLAKKTLESSSQCSYWISARERIRSQFVVWAGEQNIDNMGLSEMPEEGLGFIIPLLIPMGTITRRAVESTWLTASNAKKTRLGSELKAMVTAPPGYSFVGADVDSEELWIASLVGDSRFGFHGASAVGWMTLEGVKSDGTDLHSKTASILKISRDHAKVFNYGRIYGAGQQFAAQLLMQFNNELSQVEAKKLAATLYQNTKGRKLTSKVFRPDKDSFWGYGSESVLFNELETISLGESPRTPALGAGITEALRRENLPSKTSYLTSRVNWAIQSSGVDYLHLLILSMDYLCDLYGIDARLCLTVHDEIRYLCKDEDRFRVAMALQVSNIWTRALFCYQLGINDIPESCAFFSAIDIDHVLRKEVNMPCVTPSHPDAIPPGIALSMRELLQSGENCELGPALRDDTFVPEGKFKPIVAARTKATGQKRAYNAAYLLAQTQLKGGLRMGEAMAQKIPAKMRQLYQTQAV